MAKVVYLAENLGGYQDPAISMSGIMHHSGHNVGNFAFWSAAQKLFDAETVCMLFSAARKFLPGDIDSIVMPAANFLNATADPAIGVDWPLPAGGPALSAKDQRQPGLAAFETPFADDGRPLLPLGEAVVP